MTVKPNNPYPFTNIRSFWPFGLWVYNHFPNPPKGFKHWFYENSRPNWCSYPTSAPTFRTRMIDEIMDNNGYFRSTVDYELVPKKSNPKIAAVKYRVNAGPTYRINSVELLPRHLPPQPHHRLRGIAHTLPAPRRQIQHRLLSSVRRQISDAVRKPWILTSSNLTTSNISPTA